MNYFQLYCEYLTQCEKENWANMRDPNHDYMEWNHTLPQCIFENQPIGQWLTIEQHAIASALQTLAFGKNCLCAWHKKYLPEKILTLSWGYYKDHKRKVGKKCVANKIGIHSEAYLNSVERSQVSSRVGLLNKELGKGIFARTPEQRSLDGKLAAKVVVENKLGWQSDRIREKTRLGHMKKVTVTDPEGNQRQFSSIGEACSAYGVSGAALTKYLRKGGPISKGKNKGLIFTLSVNG